MQTIPSSETFSLQGKGLKLDTAESVAEYVLAIREQKTIRKFILSGNSVGVEAARALAGALSCRSELEAADLSDGFTGRLKDAVPLALSHFCDAFRDKRSLQSLNLSDNALGPPGAQAISAYLSSALYLKSLRINNNGLGQGGGKIIADALIKLRDAQHKKLQLEKEQDEQDARPSRLNDSAKEQRDSLGLETLVIGRNRLENEGATDLAKAIAAHSSTLLEVALPQNGIRGAGIVVLSAALERCDQLSVLDLQDNTFTAEGCAAFSKALSHWPSLRFLNLNDAYLTASGSALVFRALQSSPKLALEHLLLQYNGICSAQLAILIEALSRLVSLKSLHLNGNAFDPSSDIAVQLENALDRHKLAGILDSLSDMELGDDEDDSGAEDDSDFDAQQANSTEKEKEFDQVVQMMASTRVEEANE